MTYRFVDCRWELGHPERGRELYLAGHVPGAAFLDVDTDLAAPPGSGGGRHPLPSAAAFAASAGRAGIGSDTFVVAYGNMGGAERLWWLLRHFGHDDCAVLADGIDSWLGPLRGGGEAIEPVAFEARTRTDDTVTADELVERGSELVVVDSRLPERWRGEPNPLDRPPGRVPGALNAPWTEPPPRLPAGELVAYCGSGVTACVTLHRLSLEGRFGLLYPGGWSEWGPCGLPLERGDGTASK